MGLLDALRAKLPQKTPAWLRTAVNLFGHRRRRRWTDGRRAHLELRALDAAQFARFADAVEATFAGLGGISGVRLNGLVGRAIVEYDGALWDEDKLVTIEFRHQWQRVHGLPFAETHPDYPADVEPLLRKAVDLGADVVGVVVGSGLRLAGFSPSRAGFDLAALMTVVDNTPRLRQLLVDRLGSAATEVAATPGPAASPRCAAPTARGGSARCPRTSARARCPRASSSATPTTPCSPRSAASSSASPTPTSSRPRSPRCSAACRRPRSTAARSSPPS
jgi:hypothetical protein